MKNIEALLSRITSVFFSVSLFGLALLSLIVILFLLLGEAAGSFAVSVITNVTLLLDALTPQASVIIVLALFLVHVWHKEK